MRRLTDTTERIEAVYIAPEEYYDKGEDTSFFDGYLDEWDKEWWQRDDQDYFVSDEEYYGFQDLPFFENRWQNLMSRLGCNMWQLRFDHSWNCVEKIDGRNHWKFIYTLIETNIGKSFDQTYSYFRKKTKNELHNHYFLREFGAKRYWNYSTYHVDENGLIQKYESTKFYKRKSIKDKRYYEKQFKIRSTSRHADEINNFSYALVFNNKLSKRKKEWNREILTKEIELYEKYYRRLKESA